jgi:hypothetical protein
LLHVPLLTTSPSHQALIGAATAHATDTKVQARVVRALTNLSADDANKARIGSGEGIAMLVQVSSVARVVA